jgi:hypothetical protein
MSVLKSQHLFDNPLLISHYIILRFVSLDSNRYLDKQEFLQRADVRQFELEKEERLKRFRRMH